MPYAGWLIHSRNVFLMGLEAGSLQSGCWYGRILVRILFLAADCCLLVVASHERAERGSRHSYDSYKGTNPTHEGSTIITGGGGEHAGSWPGTRYQSKQGEEDFYAECSLA